MGEAADVSDGLVKILDGNTFVVSDERGDIEASMTDPTGLFSYDTRFLSRWILTVNGQRLSALSVDDLNYFESKFFLVPGTGTVYIDAKLSVIRQRSVGNGFREDLTILNHADKPVNLAVRLDAASDFADLFEVKDALEKKGTYSTRADGDTLVLAYDRGPYSRATDDLVDCSGPNRQERSQLQDPNRSRTGSGTPVSTSSPHVLAPGSRRRRQVTPAGHRFGCGAIWRSGWPTRHRSSVTGMR